MDLLLNCVLYVVYSYSLKKKFCSFIVQPCVVHGLPTLDQIFLFIQKTKGYSQKSVINQSQVENVNKRAR